MVNQTCKNPHLYGLKSVVWLTCDIYPTCDDWQNYQGTGEISEARVL